MTNKEILQADLLDILFENRNKAYGAYALRKNYNHRLQWALGISLGLTLFLVTIGFQKNHFANTNYPSRPDVVLSTVDISKQKAKEPEPPRQRKAPEIAQIRNTQIKITPDNQVEKPEVPTPDDLQNAMTSTINKTGISPDSATTEVNTNRQSGNGSDKNREAEPGFHPTHSDAQFPGDREAFAEFLKKYLNTPEDLDVGEKKMVLVRFMIDVDGTISKTEIVQSGGDKYDREVIRVLHKMPKWVPAMQNGIKVATYFTQPVTFVGLEE